MFQLADELAADNEESRMEQRASEIQSTSKTLFTQMVSVRVL